MLEIRPAVGEDSREYVVEVHNTAGDVMAAATVEVLKVESSVDLHSHLTKIEPAGDPHRTRQAMDVRSAGLGKEGISVAKYAVTWTEELLGLKYMSAEVKQRSVCSHSCIRQ